MLSLIQKYMYFLPFCLDNLKYFCHIETKDIAGLTAKQKKLLRICSSLGKMHKALKGYVCTWKLLPWAAGHPHGIIFSLIERKLYRDNSILDTWIFQAILPWGSSLNHLITYHLSWVERKSDDSICLLQRLHLPAWKASWRCSSS